LIHLQWSLLRCTTSMLPLLQRLVDAIHDRGDHWRKVQAGIEVWDVITWLNIRSHLTLNARVFNRQPYTTFRHLILCCSFKIRALRWFPTVTLPFNCKSYSVGHYTEFLGLGDFAKSEKSRSRNSYRGLKCHIYETVKLNQIEMKSFQ
jgi:hypothetical protein